MVDAERANHVATGLASPAQRQRNTATRSNGTRLTQHYASPPRRIAHGLEAEHCYNPVWIANVRHINGVAAELGLCQRTRKSRADALQVKHVGTIVERNHIARYR